MGCLNERDSLGSLQTADSAILLRLKKGAHELHNRTVVIDHRNQWGTSGHRACSSQAPPGGAGMIRHATGMDFLHRSSTVGCSAVRRDDWLASKVAGVPCREQTAHRCAVPKNT